MSEEDGAGHVFGAEGGQSVVGELVAGTGHARRGRIARLGERVLQHAVEGQAVIEVISGGK